MASIQYTTFNFNKPPLFNEEQYIVIKHKLQTDSSFNPFPVEGFFTKNKTVILKYAIGIPLAVVFVATEVSFFEVIVGIFSFIAIGLLFSLVPEWFSYSEFLTDRKRYYKELLKNVSKTTDYEHFKALME